MKKSLAIAFFSLALSCALCAQSRYPAQTQNNGAPIQNTGTYPAQKPTAVTPQTIYLPSGLDIQIRVNENLSSATSQPGDAFTGTLVSSIEDDNNNILFDRGTPVEGRVISVKPSGRLQDSGEIVLSLNSVRSEKLVANVTTISKTITGESHAGSNAKKVGGGAILGAIIGGLAGGGKGAAIGAGAGAAAGTGAAAATGKKEAKVDAESLVRFVTSTETAVVPAGSPADREMASQPSVYNSGKGPRDDNAPVLQRRHGSDPDNNDNSNNYPGGSTSTNPSRRSTTVARNSDPDVPILVRREESDSNTSTSTNNGTNTNTVPATTSNTSTSSNTAAVTNGNTNTATNNNPSSTTNDNTVTSSTPPTVWTFSARDKRVISDCLANNPGSAAAREANAIPYSKGDTLPYAAQKKMRSLPLACERQLLAVANDQERVIYNQQVLLINSNSLVLDAMDIPKQ